MMMILFVFAMPGLHRIINWINVVLGVQMVFIVMNNCWISIIINLNIFSYYFSGASKMPVPGCLPSNSQVEDIPHILKWKRGFKQISSTQSMFFSSIKEKYDCGNEILNQVWQFFIFSWCVSPPKRSRSDSPPPHHHHLKVCILLIPLLIIRCNTIVILIIMSREHSQCTTLTLLRQSSFQRVSSQVNSHPRHPRHQ